MGRELSPSSVACPFGTIGASLAPSAQGAVDALAGEFDPLALIDALARQEIDYVIVSGIAAMHHGATRRGAGGQDPGGHDPRRRGPARTTIGPT
jgi:hypothetical protein